MDDNNYGFVYFHRIAEKNGWLGDPWVWTMLSFVVLKAEWKDTVVRVERGNGSKTIPLKRGQLLGGRRYIAERLGGMWTVKRARRALDVLRDAGVIKVESWGSKLSVITVIKYDKYQNKAGASKFKGVNIDSTRVEGEMTTKEGPTTGPTNSTPRGPTNEGAKANASKGPEETGTNEGPSERPTTGPICNKRKKEDPFDEIDEFTGI